MIIIINYIIVIKWQKKKNYQLLKISDNEKYENSKINVYENNNHLNNNENI